MAVTIEKLSFQKIKNLKPGKKVKAHTDGGGLTLVVQPNGSKLWWYRYRFDGKRKTLSLGTFPIIGLELARELAQKAREKVARGIDPNEEKKASKLGLQSPAQPKENSFKAIAEEWLALKKLSVSGEYYQMVENRLRDYVFPFIGNSPINQITPQKLQSVMRMHEEKKGTFETINRTNKYCSEIFRYGMRRPAGSVCDRDPADLIHVDLQKPEERSYPTLAATKEDLAQLPRLMADIESIEGRELEKYAMLLMAHTFVRSTPLLQAEWSEFTLDGKEKDWFIPKEKMKGRKGKKRPLLVPLSTQVVAILKKLKRISGNQPHLFPHRSDVLGHVSENRILDSLEKLGWKGRMSGHGFRHVASTVLNENKSAWKLHEDWIEFQLAHVVGSGSRGTYNFAKYLPHRRKMMQRWSNYLDQVTKEGMLKRK